MVESNFRPRQKDVVGVLVEAVLEHEKQTVNLTKELEDEPQQLKEEKKKVLNSRLYSLLEFKTPTEMARTDEARWILSERKTLELKCIAARAVKKFGLPYKGLVPQTVEKYINMH